MIENGADLPRLLYVGDVSVADTVAGEALLYRLLQFYPPDKLALVAGVPSEASRLPGVAYHHWGAAFPRLLRSRIAQEYCLWRAWRYYEVPWPIANLAAVFRPDAILTISHVSGWLGAWQLAINRRVPLFMIAHDDFVYEDRFPRWARPWAAARFGEAYRASRARFCISPAMAETYRQRFSAAGDVIYPTQSGRHASSGVSPRVQGEGKAMTFAYGGSLNSATDMQHLIAFARIAAARGHRLVVYSPQHQLLAGLAAAASVAIDARPPIHSDQLLARLREEADCLILPQSMAPADRATVSTSFPSKWADYSTLGIPVIVWAPPGSTSERFVREHPGCAELVTTTDEAEVLAAIVRLEGSASHRRSLAETLLRVGAGCFSPAAAWHTFRSALVAARS